MDLESYDPSLLISCAIQAEIQSRDVYRTQSERTTNKFLANKLALLSSEEETHRSILEQLFDRLFPDEQISIPAENPIPILVVDGFIEDGGENKGLFEILEIAMNSELAARDYYLSMRSLFEGDTSTSKTLEYLASMELGHYRLLEHELDNQRIGQEFDALMKNY
jgi:rubrerythrin